MESISRAGAFIEWQEESGAHIAEDIIGREVRLVDKTYIMYQLRKEDECFEQYHPLLIGKEVGEGEVEEESQVKLNIEGSESFADELGVVEVVDVLTAPHQEQHLHVEDDEEDDVGEGGQDEEEVAAARTHYVLDVTHS